jgi:hypothetical protein
MCSQSTLRFLTFCSVSVFLFYSRGLHAQNVTLIGVKELSRTTTYAIPQLDILGSPRLVCDVFSISQCWLKPLISVDSSCVCCVAVTHLPSPRSSCIGRRHLGARTSFDKVTTQCLSSSLFFTNFLHSFTTPLSPTSSDWPYPWSLAIFAHQPHSLILFLSPPPPARTLL